MLTDHWFDELHRTLTEEAPRRGLFRSSGALLGGLALGTASQAGSAKKNKKGKKDKKKDKGKGNDKGNKDEQKDDPWGCEDRFQNLRIKDPNCSGGGCEATWPDDPCEQKYCEFICNQCDEDDTRDFCIVSEPLVVDKAAVCCSEASLCCGPICCQPQSPRQECCDGQCTDTRTRENCGSCGNRCAPVEDCVDGRCIVQCDPPCTAGTACCNGRCVDTNTDDVNCGECGVVCEGRRYCKDGGCRECEDGYKVCHPRFSCVPESWTCCGFRACHPTLPCCGSGDDAYCGQFGYCP